MIVAALTSSYLRHAEQEEFAWARLCHQRQVLLDSLVGEGAGAPHIRKLISQVEGKRRVNPNDPAAAQALTRLTEMADKAVADGPRSVGLWLAASREFADASDRAFRAATELSDFAGPEARQSAEGKTAMGDLKRELLAIAARINPTVDVRMVRELFGEGPGLLASGASTEDRMPVAGMYQPFYHMASISLDPRFNTRDTVYHEGFHSIEPVLAPGEQAALRRAFPAQGGMLSEERVATAFADWALRRRGIEEMGLGGESAQVRRSFRKMGLFAGRSRQALLGHGFEKAEDVFEKVYGGEMGRRMVDLARRSGLPREGRDVASLGGGIREWGGARGGTSPSPETPPVNFSRDWSSAAFSIGARESLGAEDLDAALRRTLRDGQAYELGGWRLAPAARGLVAVDQIDALAARQDFVGQWRDHAGLLMPHELGGKRIHVADEFHFAANPAAEFNRHGGTTLPHMGAGNIARHHVYVERLQPDPASALAHESFHVLLREGRITDAEFSGFRDPVNLALGRERYELDGRYPGRRHAEEFGAHYVGERHARHAELERAAVEPAGHRPRSEHVFAQAGEWPDHVNHLLRPLANGILNGTIGRRPPNDLVRAAWIDGAGWGRSAPLSPPPTTQYSVKAASQAFGMYSSEGDRLVGTLLQSVSNIRAAGAGTEALAKVVRDGIRAIAENHPEIQDTAVIELIAEKTRLGRGLIQPAWREAMANAQGEVSMAAAETTPDLRTPEGRAQMAIARNAERWHAALDDLREDMREAGIFTARALPGSEPWTLRIAKDHSFDIYLGEVSLAADSEGAIRPAIRAYEHPAGRGERPPLVGDLPEFGPLARAQQACEAKAVTDQESESSVSLSDAEQGTAFSIGTSRPNTKTPQGRAAVAIARNTERWHGAMADLQEKLREAGIFTARALTGSQPWTLRIARDHGFETYLGEVRLAADSQGTIKPIVRAYEHPAGRGERPAFAEGLPGFGPLSRAEGAVSHLAVPRHDPAAPPPYVVRLDTRGNPDQGQNPEQPLPGVRSEEIPVNSFGEAAKEARTWIEMNNLGAGNWAGGQIVETSTGETVGRVSFNGRVWEGAEWNKNHVEITPEDPRYTVGIPRGKPPVQISTSREGEKSGEAGDVAGWTLLARPAFKAMDEFEAVRRTMPPSIQARLDALPSEASNLLTAAWTVAGSHLEALRAAGPSPGHRVPDELLQKALKPFQGIGDTAPPPVPAALAYAKALHSNDPATAQAALAALIGAKQESTASLSGALDRFLPEQAESLAARYKEGNVSWREKAFGGDLDRQVAGELRAKPEDRIASPSPVDAGAMDAGSRMVGKLAKGAAFVGSAVAAGAAIGHLARDIPTPFKVDEAPQPPPGVTAPRATPKPQARRRGGMDM